MRTLKVALPGDEPEMTFLAAVTQKPPTSSHTSRPCLLTPLPSPNTCTFNLNASNTERNCQALFSSFFLASVFPSSSSHALLSALLQFKVRAARIRLFLSALSSSLVVCSKLLPKVSPGWQREQQFDFDPKSHCPSHSQPYRGICTLRHIAAVTAFSDNDS